MEDSEDCEHEIWIWKLKISLVTLQLLQLKLKARRLASVRRLHPLGRKWTRDFNTQANRARHSWFNTIIKEAALNDQVTFVNATRLKATTLELLVQRLGHSPLLNKCDTKLRKCIPLGRY